MFRTNSAYARFWEGRTAWDVVVRTCRDLARQTAAWVPVPGLRAALLRHVVVFAKALKVHLREGEDLPSELGAGIVGERLLPPDELAMLIAARSRPLYCLAYMTTLVARAHTHGGMSEKCQMALDGGLCSLQGAVATCDKLFNTPIPCARARGGERACGGARALPLSLWLVLSRLAP